MKKAFAAALFVIIAASQAFAFSPEGVPRVTVEELKSRMEAGAATVVLDVRSKGSYDISPVKIKGAVRIAPNELEARLNELPRDKEIVAYCT